jgi:histone H3/H4
VTPPGRAVVNRSGVKRVAKRCGVQISDDAVDLVNEAAYRTIEAAAARAKAVGRRRVDEGFVRGVLRG